MTAAAVATIPLAAPCPLHCAPPPNIVLIVADDLGWGDPGCYGQQKIRTPHLDTMAREGLRFTQFYAGAAVCAPSRAVLLTGIHTGKVSVDRNYSPNLPLAPNERTVAEMLREKGYRTVLSGKWGLGGAKPSHDYGGSAPGANLPHGGGDSVLTSTAHSLPTRRGFDESLSVVDQEYAHQHFPEFVWRGDKPTTIPENAGKPQDRRPVYAQDLFTSAALDAIHDADGRQRLFLFVSYLLPHRQIVDPPGTNPYSGKPWPAPEKGYAAMVTRLDADVGRILDAVDANAAIASNTLVMFTSDNGPAQVDGHDPRFFDSSGGLRGRKSSVYEGGIRVPCIARWRGHTPEGAVCKTPCGFEDFMPTVADLAGTTPPAGVTGSSFAPALAGAPVPARRMPMVWFNAELGGGPGGRGANAAARDDRWKLVVKADGAVELYDISADTTESRNLAAQHPDVARRLESLVRREIRQPLPATPKDNQ